MSITMYILRNMRHLSTCYPKPTQLAFVSRMSFSENKGISARMAEFKKKMEEVPFPNNKPEDREITPIMKLDQKTLQHPKMFEYPEWPDNTNPHTGEVGGPRGPEPTRYGDWERKGRCSDF